MARRILSLAFAGLILATALAHADQALPNAVITNGGDLLLGTLKLGKRQAGQTVLAPDALTAGDATRASNPFAGPYPSWVSGVGGSGYSDIKPLGNAAVWAPNGSANFTNLFPYGSLNTAGAGTFSVGVNRPGCVAGFTSPSQSAAYDEFGSYALCAQGDTMPLMAAVSGTFTANSFVPTTPTTLSDTVKLGVGMWIRTNDSPAAYNGQITSWTVNGAGQVTAIAVSGWYQRGGGAGTPTGTRAFINPLDKLWGMLLTPFANGIPLIATTQAGSKTVTVNSTVGLYPGGHLIEGPGIPPNTVIAGLDYAANTIQLEKAATATASNMVLTATAGTEFGKYVAAEIDVFNSGVAFAPTWVSGSTGNTTKGSYLVTNVTSISMWRSGLIVYGAGIPDGTTVTFVDTVNNTLTLKRPATANATGVALQGINQLDEGGTALDCVGPLKNANTCYLQRGSVSYGFLSMGAGDTSFLVRPDKFAGIPLYGFRVDGKINGHPSAGDFAVTNDNVEVWKIDGFGNETVQSVNSATDYKIQGMTVIDNAAWASYTPTVACAGGGSLTTGTVSARYKRIGKTVMVTAKVPLTASSCTSGINVTLPFSSAFDTPIQGRDMGKGVALVGLAAANSNAVLVQRYDGTVPSASGVLIGLTYETP
ncbi:hypothetical protein Mnod_6333 [Methylobacterium nodulans ORS 2060]|uniref:Uncharacterized protein n=2 Tax=Methylobacterium nodulans TaxID=114616 RepID=B8IAT3_METNO|nr:hypothetical protein Mnod_6333 [Methylobacterium nodulans ORS 2060]